jgi:hypothetical protein
LAEKTFRVTNHGARQIQIRLDYLLPPGADTVSYALDLYLFFPAELGMNRGRYDARRFLEDLHDYTRNAPPGLSFGEILDPASGLSPLQRLRRIAHETPAPALAADADRIGYELRQLVNAFRAEGKRRREVVREEIRRGAAPEEVLAALGTALSEMRDVRRHYRALLGVFTSSAPDERPGLDAAWADEALSLDTERHLFAIHDACRARPGYAEVASRLLEEVREEAAYRERQGYLSTKDPDDPRANERFLYRLGMLKKWAQSATYLTARPSRAIDRITQALYAVAAGIAMLAALGVTFLAGTYFSQYSLPWLLLAVVAYMLKDRIKDGVRSVFLRFVPALVADEKRILRDPALHGRVGDTRARVRFLSAGETPRAVRERRERGRSLFRSFLPGESVIHFHKRTRLCAARLLRHHERLGAVLEILRLHIGAWLVMMDDPVREVHHVEDGTRREVPTPWVYHVNAVVRYAREGDPEAPAWARVRFVVNRDGVVRIDRIPDDSA